MIFVDTGAWLNLFDRGQNIEQIRQAKTYLSSTNEALCTSALIIAETYKWLIHHERPTHFAMQVLRLLVSQKSAIIVQIEESDHHTAINVIEQYADQKLSYEDAITVALAYRLRIKKVFSFDRHFLLFPGIEKVPN